MQPHSVQVREVQEAGSIRVHLFNPWNLVEVTSLASLSAGFIFRTWAYVCHGQGEYFCGEMSASWVSVSDLNEVYLAQYFLAASAPFVLGKVLFLTQVNLVLVLCEWGGLRPGVLLVDTVWQINMDVLRRCFDVPGAVRAITYLDVRFDSAGGWFCGCLALEYPRGQIFICVPPATKQKAHTATER